MSSKQSRYIQQDKLGRGGYGTVYKAWDKELEREVALKIFHQSQTETAQEARNLAQVNSPNVVTIYDILQWDGQQAIVMEYVDNAMPLTFESLKHFSHTDFVNFLISAARGLKAIHDKGIIHGDIKLSNMLMEPSKRVLLTDFGLAQAKNKAKLSTRTSNNKISGSWECLTPEQLKGHELTDKTDIFALGIILFSVIYGRHPFISNNDPDQARNLLAKPVNFNDLQLLNDQFIPFQSLCQSMLQIKANKRPSSDEVLEVLLAVLQPVTTSADWSTETIEIETSPEKPAWLLMSLISLFTLIAIGFGGYYLLSPQEKIKTLVVPALVHNQTDGSLSAGAQFDLSLLEKSKKLSVIVNDELVDSVLSAPKRMLIPRREWRGERNWSKVADKLLVDEILFSEINCTSSKSCDIKVALYSKLESKVTKLEKLSVPADNLLVFAELINSLSSKMIGLNQSQKITQNIDENSLQQYVHYRANIETLPVNEVISGLKKLSQKNPGFTGITVQLGKVYLKQFDNTQDSTWLNKTKEAAELISDTASGQELLFWYYLEINQFENAKNALEQLQQRPNIDYTNLVLRHAMLLFERGEKKRAVKYLKRQKEIRKNGSYFYFLSYMLDILGSYKEMLTTIDQWLTLDTDNKIAKEYQLIAFIKLGEIKQAIRLGNSLQSNILSYDFRYNLSLAYLLNRDYQKSIEGFTSLKNSSPNRIKILINLADAYKGAGDIEASNRLYKTYVDKIKSFESTQWKELAYLSLAYANLGESSNSLMALQEMTAKASNNKVADSTSYYVLSSQIYSLLGQQDAAYIHGKKAIESGAGLHSFNLPWLTKLKTKLKITLPGSG